MSPKQQLDDLIALREALQSQRRWLLGARNNRGARTAKVKSAVRSIRAARAAIETAVAEIALVRDVKATDTQIDAIDIRLKQLSARIGQLDRTNTAAQTLMRMQRMKEQFAALNASLPDDLKIEDIL